MVTLTLRMKDFLNCRESQIMISIFTFNKHKINSNFGSMTSAKKSEESWRCFFEKIGVLGHQKISKKQVVNFKIIHPAFWIPSWNASIELVKKIPKKTDFLEILKKDRTANTIIVSGVPFPDKYSVRLISKEKGIYDFLEGAFFMCKECPALFFGVYDKGSKHIWASKYLGHPYAKKDCTGCGELPVLTNKLKDIYESVSVSKFYKKPS